MARERMVTRTIEEHVYTVMGMDISTKSPVDVVFTVGAPFADDEKALKYARKYHESANVKLVMVTNHTVSTALYGMPEVEFMKYAKVLPNRGE